MNRFMCGICHRFVNEPYWRHNQRHLEKEPHVFCQTIRCDNGDDCPVKDNQNQGLTTPIQSARLT